MAMDGSMTPAEGTDRRYSDRHGLSCAEAGVTLTEDHLAAADVFSLGATM